MVNREAYDAAPVELQVKLARIYKALTIAEEVVKIHVAKSNHPLQPAINARRVEETVTRLSAIPAEKFLRFDE